MRGGNRPGHSHSLLDGAEIWIYLRKIAGDVRYRLRLLAWRVFTQAVQALLF